MLRLAETILVSEVNRRAKISRWWHCNGLALHSLLRNRTMHQSWLALNITLLNTSTSMSDDSDSAQDLLQRINLLLRIAVLSIT